MRLLLDTHIALWALTGERHLGIKAQALIEDANNEVFVSSASLWEISIKHSLGRGDMPMSGADAARFFAEAGYRALPVTWQHAATVETLPLHHNDPFDRILIAQALSEPMRLVSRDQKLTSYGEMVLSV